MSFKIAIPARYASSRLPGKPLLKIAGKPMLQHVYELATRCGAEQVVIATDDKRIRVAAEDFGADVCMTSSEHPSGSDRLAELATCMDWNDEDIVVNLQGDEPLIPPELLKIVADGLNSNAEAAMATLCTPIRTTAELFDPHVVKVVTDRNGFALYFSRAPIPWDREAFAVTTESLPDDLIHYRHLGIYAYRVGYLHRYADTPACVLEQTEVLEQLRALWSGERIHVTAIAEPPGHGVDTAEDLKRVETLLGR